MATGINSQAMNGLKVSLLDYIEAINALHKRFENCSYQLGHCISGPGSRTVAQLLREVDGQFSVVISNINSYISDLNKVQKEYIETDMQMSSRIISDITTLDKMKGD